MSISRRRVSFNERCVPPVSALGVVGSPRRNRLSLVLNLIIASLLVNVVNACEKWETCLGGRSSSSSHAHTHSGRLESMSVMFEF